METEEAIETGEVQELELKYCERCGALWLRVKGCDEVYCGPCVPKMAEFPRSGLPRARQPRWPAGDGLIVRSLIDQVVELCIRGGQA